jgi:hypothetical protein
MDAEDGLLSNNLRRNEVRAWTYLLMHLKHRKYKRCLCVFM